MEKFQEAHQKALKHLRVADHMLTVTYPLVNDTRLLLKVVDNLFLAMTNSISAILHHEQYYKRIPVFADNFESKFNIFKTKCVNRLRFDRRYLQFILDLKNTILQHKQSPITFSRKDSYVICSDTYQIQKITTKKLKGDLQKTRLFVYKMNEIVSDKNAGIY